VTVHAVQVQRGFVDHEHAVVLPRLEDPRRFGVGVVAAREVDAHDVVRVLRDKGVALILVDDVIGRRRDEREVIGGVADAGERGEARNRAILADVNWVLDLDGVIWLSDTPIPGSADAVAALEAAGERLVFVTNNSNPTVEENEAKLAAHGIDARGRLVSSAMAAATLVEPGERALLCAGPGTEQALVGRGATIVRDGAADVVVVGFHREFDYERMRIASTAVRNGARLVATNDRRDVSDPRRADPRRGLDPRGHRASKWCARGRRRQAV